MRLTLLAVAALLAFSTVAIVTPSAEACTGDPSVCGLVHDVKCTLKEGGTALYRCFYYVGPVP